MKSSLAFVASKSSARQLLPASYIKHLINLALIMLAFAGFVRVNAQTCEDIPEPGTESISASITFNNSGATVKNVVPPNTPLRIDAVATAYGWCTGMGLSGGDCVETGYVYQREINHINIWAEIHTENGIDGAYSIGKVWPTPTTMHVVDTQSANSTGPVFFTPPYAGSYQLHIQGIINTTPCGLQPDVTEDLIITIYVGDNEGAGAGSCPSGVGKPINVTNGNMYVQQTDYRLPGIGGGLDLTRTYNSRQQRAGVFGYGWSSLVDESITTLGPLLARLKWPDGTAIYLGRTSTADPYMPKQPMDFHGQ